MKKKMTVHRLLSGALVLLGFASCSNEDENWEIRCEYGTPYSKFLVKGTVTSDKDEPLKNIQVIVRQDWNNGVFPADTIYTDEKGVEHCVHTVCPHMKCHLIFNEKECTWDCPCHGSRFDIDGNVLEGPSVFDIHIEEQK